MSKPEDLIRKKILVLAFLFEGGAFLISLALAHFLGISFSPLSRNVGWDILLGTAAALPPFGFFLYTVSGKGQAAWLTRSLRNTALTDIKRIFDGSRAPDLVVISLLAGFGEELFFRGILQEKLGIILASLVFGLVHCVSPAYVVMTTIMGFYLGGVLLATDSLLVVIQAHFIYDLGALIYIRYFARAGRGDDILSTAGDDSRP